MLRFVAVILFCYFVSYTFGRNLVEWMLRNSELTSEYENRYCGIHQYGLIYGVKLFLSKVILCLRRLNHEERM